MAPDADREHDPVRVGIVFEIDDSPITLYIWARLCAAALIDELNDNGVVATLVRVDIDSHSGLA